MNTDEIIWFGRYEGWLRLLARGVRDGDRQCVEKAARLFDLMLPDDCVVVPMPSHNGTATTMLSVALRLENGRRAIANRLTCDPHESSCSQKLSGVTPAPMSMAVELPRGGEWGGREIYVIDNVVASGVTASAALAAFRRHNVGNMKVCALARSVWR